MKLWNRASRGQSVTSLRFIHSRALPSSTTSSPLSTTSLTSHSATDRKSQTYSYSHSGCFVFPSFFIKLPKQKSGSIVDSCRRSSLPTQPAGPASRLRAPSSPQARSLPVPSLSSTVSAFSRLQVRPVRSGWSHRKTKTENEVPCFVFFIDE